MVHYKVSINWPEVISMQVKVENDFKDHTLILHNHDCACFYKDKNLPQCTEKLGLSRLNKVIVDHVSWTTGKQT